MVLKGEITMDVEKVIKALEWLIVNFPKQDNPKDDSDRLCNCINLYCQNAVDLIKRQQAEIERLKEIANPKCQQCVEQTRKNGIVEFANELQRRMFYWSYDFQHNSECIAAEREVDDLVKELTEGSKR